MGTIVLLSLLGWAAGFAVYDALTEDDDNAGASTQDNDDGPEQPVDPLPDPDPVSPPQNNAPESIIGTDGDDVIDVDENSVVSGSGGDDTLSVRYDYTSEDVAPATISGGDGADVFEIGFPSHRDADRDYDLLITDFDPEEDLLRLDLFDQEVGHWHENMIDLTVESSEDDSFTDLHITLPYGDSGTVATIRLEGLAGIDPNDLDFGNFELRQMEDGSLQRAHVLAVFGAQDGDTLTTSVTAPAGAEEHILSPLGGNDTVVSDAAIDSFVMLGEGDDLLTVVNGHTGAIGGAGDDTFVVSFTDAEAPEDLSANLFGDVGDDTFIVESQRGAVTLHGGEGDDRLITHEAIGDAPLILRGEWDNDTYVFRMGQSVDEFHSTGDDSYTMVITPDTLATATPSTILFNGENDDFTFVVPDGREGDLRIEPLPYDEDGTDPYIDEVYLGDTLVARLMNDYDGNFSESGAQLTVVAASDWTAPV